ncbi:hypothetical protein LEP1GSC172_1515 [Leptospira noguchii]|uniref:Uncharacterized protein n=1 Tax=Leptospira noguchii TaxID=28182 RepID=M6VDE1_9LEPT|nr:hypothetical protein LEP1GSC172_1515 [Leptospira noguchii]
MRSGVFKYKDLSFFPTYVEIALKIKSKSFPKGIFLNSGFVIDTKRNEE